MTPRLRSALTRALLTAALLMLPSAASAQWFVFPFAASNAGGATTAESAAFGGTFGWMSSWIGGEGEIALSPSFFDDGDGFRTAHRQTTYTATLLAGPMLGRMRPYGLVGGGLFRTKIEEVGGLARLSEDRPALHVGGGLMVDATRRFGVRGDVRYVRAVDDEEPAGNVFNERLADFDYWRVGGGVTVRW